MWDIHRRQEGKEPSSPMSRVVVESKQHSHNLFRHMIQGNERQMVALERSHYLVDQMKVKEKVRIYKVQLISIMHVRWTVEDMDRENWETGHFRIYRQ